MNTRPPIEASDDPTVLSVAFNHDASKFSVGLNSGFSIFDSSRAMLQAATVHRAGLAVVQMMGNANYLALVGGGPNPKFPQNKVILWDDHKKKVAFEITTLTSVRGVQLTRHRVVVVLQNSVRVYAFEKPPNCLAKYETADNLLGLCCLTDRWLVFPGRTAGQVQVVELATDNVSIIPAHTGRLQALRLSPDGELLATASEKGTLVRVFSTGNCARVAERRRGTDFATIYSLAFNPSGNLLACTSAKGSLHIFDLPLLPPRTDPAAGSGGGGGGGGPARSTPPHSPQRHPGPGTGTGVVVEAPSSSGNKWGILSNIPFGPFSDVYSFASARFEAGDEAAASGPALEANTVLGTTRPAKGVIGWIDDGSLVVVGAGRDARWERFTLVRQDGGRILCREGWRRYMRNFEP